MAICMVCKANGDVGGKTYTVDGNIFRLCKSCYGKVETHLLVVCPTCGFYWFSYDKLSKKNKEGTMILRPTTDCVKCQFNNQQKALPAP